MENTTPDPNLDPAANQGAEHVDPAAGSSAQQVDDIPYTAQQIRELEYFAQRAAVELEKIKPYREDIEELVNDEKLRNFYRESKKYYKNGLEQIEQSNASPVDDDVREVVSYVKQQRQREIDEHNSREAKFYQEQRTVGDRLRKEHNLNDEQISFLANTADTMARQSNRNVGLDEAFNQVRKFSPTAGSTPPTVSLRGDSSTPGVPSASTNRDRWKSDFHGALTDQLRAGKS